MRALCGAPYIDFNFKSPDSLQDWDCWHSLWSDEEATETSHLVRITQSMQATEAYFTRWFVQLINLSIEYLPSREALFLELVILWWRGQGFTPAGSLDCRREVTQCTDRMKYNFLSKSRWVSKEKNNKDKGLERWAGLVGLLWIEWRSGKALLRKWFWTEEVSCATIRQREQQVAWRFVGWLVGREEWGRGDESEAPWRGVAPRRGKEFAFIPV